MSFFNNGAGVTITGSKIFFAKKLFEEKRLIISDAFSIDSEEGITEDISEIALISLLEDALRKSEENFDEISFTFPLNFYTSFYFPLEEKLTNEEIQSQILWEFSQLLPEAESEQYAVSFFISELNDKRYVNAFTLKKRNIEILQKFVLRKNLKLKFIDHPAISAVNAFKAVKKDLPESVLFFYFEENEFAVLLISDNQIKRIKSINFNPENLTELLEREKKIFTELVASGSELTVAVAGYISGDEIGEKINSALRPVEINYLAKLSGEEFSDAESAAYAPILGLFLRVS